MTVISGFNVCNVPVLIGDILISSEIDGDNNLSLPTVSNISDVFPAGSGFEPTGLFQKIAVIGDNIAIAWAGRRILATSIIRKIDEINACAPLNWVSLAGHLSEMKRKNELEEISLLAYIVDNGQLKIIPHNAKIIDTKQYGLAYVAGGCSGYLDGLMKAERLPRTNFGQMNNLDLAISFVSVFNGTYLHKEMIDRENLLHYYGGGYEGAFYTGSKFGKIDDVTYCFWKYGEDSNSKGLYFRKLIKQFYYNDILCYFIIEPEEMGCFDNFLIRQIAVPPILRRICEDEYSRIKFLNINSRYTCHSFSIQLESGLSALAPLFQCEDSYDRLLVKFSLNHDQFKIDFHPNFFIYIETLRNEVRNNKQ